MTKDELDTKRHDLMDKRDKIIDELKVVTAEYHELEDQEAAESIVEGLSEAQRIAVASVLNVSSVGAIGVK